MVIFRTHFDMDSSSAYSSSDMAVCYIEWREDKSENKEGNDELSDDGDDVFLTWDSVGHWLPLRVRVTKPRILSRRPQPRMILGQAGQPCQTAAVILLIEANISDQSNLGPWHCIAWCTLYPPPPHPSHYTGSFLIPVGKCLHVTPKFGVLLTL